MGDERFAEFTHLLAHELRRPLSSIRLCADIIEEELEAHPCERVVEHLKILEAAVHRAQATLDDLLAYGDAGCEHELTTTVELPAFLRKVVSSMALAADAEVHVAPDLPTLRSDPQLLEQIFANLVANALTYNRSSPRKIEIGVTAADPEKLELFVRDNGIGIDKRYQRKIFEIFERLHPQHEYPGTGIGLAIVAKAAERLGGHVRVDSAPGSGSTFSIVLPASSVVARDYSRMTESA